MATHTSVIKGQGFALPTVLIASVVLLIVLATSVTATTAARTALKEQYYTQLAQIAGEAGVAMATACLQANNNVVTWSDVAPLRPASNCSGVISGITCPADARCWVTIEDNVRSGFSVPAPDVDANGRPVKIEQTGYVELIRESTSAVWRTYYQPSVQSAVVPALCSGAARSDLGWANAVTTTLTGTFPSTTARPISISSGSTVPGPIQYRKDFNIAEAGVYTIQTKAVDSVELYIDGALLGQSSGFNDVIAPSITLEPGCHVLHATVTKGGVTPAQADFILSMKKQGGSQEVIVSDASWRVSAGNQTTFSEPSYSRSSSWLDARVISAYNAAPFAEPTSWTATTSDTTASWISSNSNYSGNDYPFASYTYFRSKSAGSLTLGAATSVRFSIACDNSCALYVDGNVIMRSEVATAVSNVIMTLSPGPHTIGVELYNDGASNNPSGFLFSVKRTSDNVVLDRSSANWSAVDAWYGSAQNFTSYETTHYPSPDTFDCQCLTQGATNVIANPSSETNSTGYTSNRATLSRSTSAEHDGTYGQRATVSSVGSFPKVILTESNIKTGQVYQLSGYIKASVNSRLGYQFVDATGAVVQIGTTASWETSPVNPGGAWSRFSMTTQPVPPGATAITIWVGVADNTSINTVFDVDSIMMNPGSTLYQYADGTFTDWRWLGTAHGSISSGKATP